MVVVIYYLAANGVDTFLFDLVLAIFLVVRMVGRSVVGGTNVVVVLVKLSVEMQPVDLSVQEGGDFKDRLASNLANQVGEQIKDLS